MGRCSTVVLALATVVATSAVGQPPANLDRGLEQLVADYTGLYRKDSFDRWRTLFLPSFTVGSTTAEGGASTRTLEQFLAAQARSFAESKEMGERLENVRIERRGRIASVWADFVFWYDGESRRGRLVLLAIADQTGWHFQSLLFSYHD